MSGRRLRAQTLLAVAMSVATACGGGERSTSPVSAEAPLPSAKPTEDNPLPAFELETQLPEPVQQAVLSPFTGDFDEMLKREVVRIGVTFSRTEYYVDKGVQRGIAYEYGRLIEDRINGKLRRRHSKVHVFFVPMSRDQLLSGLVSGRVDMVAGNLTITPERQRFVDFTDPTRTNVNETLVTPPGQPVVRSVDDLSGRRVFVRASTSYYQSLLDLNDRLRARGKAPVLIEIAPENLFDDDLLEMVNAELLPAVIVDDYLARFWRKVLPNLVLHENIAVRTGGNLGVAIRKSNPKLRAALNRFLGKYGLGSAFGNQIERRYLINTTYAKNATSEAERRKFLAVVDLFRKYGERYDLDFLLMAAQGYQESRLDHSARSPVGAIGIMQLMPATGKELNVGDITRLEPNIHGGVKYMRQIMDANFKDEPIDRLNRALFTFASYNAGPGRIRQLRRETAKRGLDPNVWFGNVEQTTSARIGSETVTYVSNIYKYYVAYRLVVEEQERRAAAREDVAGTRGKK